MVKALHCSPSSTVVQMSKKSKRRANKAKKAKEKRRLWLVTSPECTKFAKICEKHGWHQRDSLPPAGAKEAGAKELQQLVNRGLGNGKPFPCNQLNRKFKHWQGSFATEKEICGLDESKIETSEELVIRLKMTDVWRFATRSRLVLCNKSGKSHAELFESHLDPMLSDLRETVIGKFNDFLFDDKSQEKDRYTDFEKQTLED